MNHLQAAAGEAIKKGITYLRQHQFPNGEFCCYIGHEDHLKDTIPYSTVFPTSLICYSLLKLSHFQEVKEILGLSGTFLQFQSMRGGVWNNFTTWSPLFPLCPADVDNTSCASKVLQATGREYTDNRKILLANRAKSGLFYTWYTLRPNTVQDKNYWMLLLREYKNPIGALLFWHKFECNRNDIDAVVNANVLFYLGLDQSTAPIVKYLLEIIANHKEEDCDLWYRNPFSIYYFFSRIYNEGIKELEPLKQPIIERIVSTVKADGSLGNCVLDTAFGIISLLHLNYQGSIVEQAVEYLMINQGLHGDWPRWAVFYGGPKKLSCFGSEELTTGFCLEALALYQIQNDEGI